MRQSQVLCAKEPLRFLAFHLETNDEPSTFVCWVVLMKVGVESANIQARVLKSGLGQCMIEPEEVKLYNISSCCIHLVGLKDQLP